MNYTVYTLYSPDYDKIYIGYSSDFVNRFISHNEKGKKGWTVKYRPWKVVFTESYKTKKEAMQRERQLKTARGARMFGRKFGKNLGSSSSGSYPPAGGRRFPQSDPFGRILPPSLNKSPKVL